MDFVNGCHKGIRFGNTFENILQEREKKNLIFLANLYIFHKSGIKTFLNLLDNKYGENGQMPLKKKKI